MLFSSCVFRHRPRDYARPAARATQTSARATRPDRLLQAWRVAPSSDPRSAHDKQILRKGKRSPRTSSSRCSTSRRSGGACTSHDRWRHALQRDEREHHRVRPWPNSCNNSCSVLTMLPCLTLATTLGLLLQREEVELELLLARAPRAAHVTRERSIDRENQDEERRKTCLSCYSRATFTHSDIAGRARAAVLREVEHLEVDVRGPRSPSRRIVLAEGRGGAGG